MACGAKETYVAVRWQGKSLGACSALLSGVTLPQGKADPVKCDAKASAGEMFHTTFRGQTYEGCLAYSATRTPPAIKCNAHSMHLLIMWVGNAINGCVELPR